MPKRTKFLTPGGVSVNTTTGRLTPCTGHYEKRLSQVRAIYRDQDALDALLAAKGDIITYEVYEYAKSAAEGHLIFGTSILYPGKVGKEYFMTRGHSHAKADRAEVYYCLAGKGLMLMESPDGKSKAVTMRPRALVYVPPYWKHRSVNTGRRKLIFVFACPADAGHEYGEIEKKGMRKIVIEFRGRPALRCNQAYGKG